MPHRNLSTASDNDPEPGTVVAIASFSDELSVHLAASKLEEEGIRVVVEDPPQPIGGAHTATLTVLADDAAKAIEILKQTPARDNLI